MDWLLGDLHGCVRGLEDFLKLSQFDPAVDQLWCLGDLINKGPHSVETLRLTHEVGGKILLGNHEIYALCCWLNYYERKHDDTLDEILQSSEGQGYLEGLLKAPLMAKLPLESGRTLWMIHGGIHPAWSLRLDALQKELNESHLGKLERLCSPLAHFATQARCCTAEGEMIRFTGHPDDCPPPHLPWDSHFQGDDLIVHGHWAMRGHYRGKKSIGLDGGYVYGRSVWAYCVQDDRFLEVKNLQGPQSRPPH